MGPEELFSTYLSPDFSQRFHLTKFMPKLMEEILAEFEKVQQDLCVISASGYKAHYSKHCAEEKDMSSKTGKIDNKSKTNLFRSASSLSDDAKSVEMSRASSDSSLSGAVSQIVSKMAVSKNPSYEAGAAGEDWNMPGFLNLKELNSLLLKYIGLNRSKSGGNSSITVSIDRSEILNLKSKYDNQLADWKKQCDLKDKDIAALNTENKKFKAEIKKLKESNANKDGAIKERDLTVEGLRGKISKSQGKLNAMTNAFTSEKNHSLDLGSRLASMEKELRFKIDVLGSELATEREKTSIDISSLESRIKKEYADRLKEELKMMRKIYEEHMSGTKEKIERTYKNKISELEVSLAVQMNSVKPKEDIKGLKVELEKYKKKIDELESNNRDLNMQWGRLAVELKDKETEFHSKMSAKEIEMTYLAKQSADYKKMYEDMRSKLMLEESEVKVYNRLITPEINRISSLYKDHFINGKGQSKEHSQG